jgi:hypothetical protein
MRLLGLVRCDGTAASVAFPGQPRSHLSNPPSLHLTLGQGRQGIIRQCPVRLSVQSTQYNTTQHDKTARLARQAKARRTPPAAVVSVCLSASTSRPIRGPWRRHIHAYKQLHTNTIALHRHLHTRYRIQETNRIAVSAYVRAWGRHQDNLEDGKLLQII